MRWLALCCLLCLAPGPALAAESGTLSGSVFRATTLLPWGGVSVEARGEGSAATTTTDDLGAFSLELAPGTYRLVVLGGPPSDPVFVGPGELSEALLTVTADGSITRALIEAPDPEDVVVVEVDERAFPGVVDGRLTDAEKDAPIADARIFVRGSDAEATTDPEGRFELTLPPGTWRLSVVKPGFATGRFDVEVVSETRRTLEIALEAATPELQEFVVLMPRIAGSTSALLDERKESTAVSDVLGAEQMSASGDSSAAAALKRVSGLTVVGGKYVYVRGLGERYSATLLNGASLPSPEPERRVVPLDLFPTKMLDSVVIQKTFSPDMPAEFGGGVVRLRTRSVPEGPVASVSVSGGLQTGGTFTKSLRYEGGPTDWLGFGKQHRALPELIVEASRDEAIKEGDRFSDAGFTAEELESFGEAMPQVWALDRKVVPPDVGIGLTTGFGHTWDSGQKLGVLFGANYGQGWDQREETRTYFVPSDSGLQQQHEYDFETLERSVKLGGILAVGGAPHRDHHFDSTTIVTRISEDEGRVYSGLNVDVGQIIEISRLRYVEQMLVVQQLRGDHTITPLNRLNIDWRLTFSRAFRDEPDRREYRYDLEDGTQDEWLLSDRPEGNQRFFSSLQDEGFDAGVDVTQPIPIWLGQEMKVKAEVVHLEKSRGVDTRRFKYFNRGSLSTAASTNRPPERVFTDETIGEDGFKFEEFTQATDNYTASQEINAAYGLVELPIVDRFELMTGVRVERSLQEVTTFELFNPDGVPVVADLKTTDVLPAFTGTLRLLKDRSMAVRFGYGLTLSRPDFRELSPAAFSNVTGGRLVFGNPELERALIHSADARWEWYLSPTESLSVAVFYKRFIRPIETTVVPSAQLSVTWLNQEGADNVGTELDWRKDFGFIAPPLRDLFVAGNLAVIYSRIRLDPEESTVTNAQRPMQGQSPVVVNVSVGYDNPDIGTRATVLYNVFGRRIDEVGALGSPDVYEQPFHQLDVVASQRLPGGFRLGLTAKNLIDHPARWTIGERIHRTGRRGREIGLSLSWDAAKAFKPKQGEAE